LLHVISWWLLIQLLGLAALPLAYRLFKWLPGRGYAFAKPLGLLLTSYLLWMGASLGYLRNTLGAGVVAIVATATLSIGCYLWRRDDDEPSLFAFLRDHRRMILTVEILFAAGFLAWAGLRAYAPDKIMSSGGEKFMEIAFLNAILRSPTFPPHDPWLSGFAISYYYFGYVMMALMTRLSGVLPGVGFELYDALIFALTLTGAFGVVHGLVSSAQRNGCDEGQALRYGLLGSLFVAVMGNLEGLLETLYARGLLPGAFWRWIDIPDLIEAGRVTGSWYPGHGWWWWRASRVIRDRTLLGQPMPLNPIDEFPFFSFLLGDNHPHVLALPFVLMAMGLAFNLLRRERMKAADHGSAGSEGERREAAERGMASAGAADRGSAGSSRERQDDDLSRGEGYTIASAGEELAGVGARADRVSAWSNREVADQGSAASSGEREAAASRAKGVGRLRLGPVAYALDGDWVLFAFCALALGALGFLNTWDFPIYLGLVVLAYGAGRYARADETLVETLQRAAVLGLALTVVGALLYLPFYIGFSSQAGGLVPYLLAPTRLPQYLVMFGPFVFVVTSFLLIRLWIARDCDKIWASFARAWGVVVVAPLLLLALTGVLAIVTEPGLQIVQSLLADPRVQQIVGSDGVGAALRAIVTARLRDPWLFLTLSLLIAGAAVGLLQPWRRRDDTSESADATQFTSLLLLCGLGLTFVVEFVYLRDSFGVRMNTIFKFYYQAWVMLGCASAFGVWWILNGLDERTSTAVQTIFLVGAVILTAAGLVYPALASWSRVDGFRHPPNLNGASNVAQNHPDDWAAIEWLRTNAEGTPVILEAPGKSYDYEGRISAFTGYPAVLGWALHESQWRGSYQEQGQREPDIATIYTSPNDQQRLDLLRKWEVDYVIVGPPERRYAEELCQGSERTCNATQALRRFDELLQPAFQQGRTTIYRVPQASG